MSDEIIDKDLEISGHNYDGITELDNPMPDWWLWTFLFTMIFAFLYYLHYEIAGGPTLKEELTVAMQEIEKNKSHEPTIIETEELLLNAMKNPKSAELGAQVYASKCVACHGTDLQGQVGPNLTDKYWIHGKGTRMDIVKVVREGVLEKGMPSWGQMISKDEIYGVTAFIVSKKGSNPPHPKAPQGEPVE